MITLESQKRIQIYEKAKKDPALAIVYALTEILTQADKIIEERLKEASKDIKGEKGDPGEKGDTPIKGKNYFTDQEIEEFATAVLKVATPRKGEHYFTQKDIDGFVKMVKQYFPKAIKGDKGDDGKTPKAGTDYPSRREFAMMISEEIQGVWGKTNERIDKIAKKVVQEMFSTKNAQKLARALEALQGNQRLDHSALKNSPDVQGVKLYNEKKKTLKRGGGAVVQIYDLSSLLDGVTKTFTLPTNSGIRGVWSSSAPFGAFRKDIDYTATSNSITFTDQIDASSTLSTGQSLVILYIE